MELFIRPVQEADRAFWFSLDHILPKEGFERVLSDGRGYVLLLDNEPAALLRYGLFWDHIPFCNLLYIKDGFRRMGLGKALMRFWENEMHERGHHLLMTSTQADEEAQHFYRKLGYRDAGGLLLSAPGFEQPMELFLVKELPKRPEARLDETNMDTDTVKGTLAAGSSQTELDEAGRALRSTLNKCRAIRMENLPKGQQTLLSRRVKALELALKLIERESASFR